MSSITVQQREFKYKSSKSNILQKWFVPFWWLGKEKKKTNIKPRQTRKFSLQSATEEANEENLIRLRYQKVCKEINQIIWELSWNGSNTTKSKTKGNCSKNEGGLTDEVKAKLIALKKEKEQLKWKLKVNYIILI